jgi:tRNA1Val (adenine37-N6)-methyltransferase
MDADAASVGGGGGGAGGGGGGDGGGGGTGGGGGVPELVPRGCIVCGGRGYVVRARKAARRSTPSDARPRKTFPGFIAPGPPPAGERGLPRLACGEDEELCSLSGQWLIFQRFARHRYSTDDVVTAWYAWTVARAGGLRVARALDVGCGIGSVLLFTAWLFPDASCVGIEAQEARAAMARRSAEYNLGVESRRVTVVSGDARTDDGELGLFDLVTGTPPYFDVSQGGMSSCAESAACLFEFRGGIEAYCATASRHVAPGGRFVVCEAFVECRRVAPAAAAAGLRVISRLDVVPKQVRLAGTRLPALTGPDVD